MCIAKLISDTQVYLPALEGHVPSEMIHTLRAFIEFCYIVRQDVHDTNTLNELQDALNRFQHYRTIFQTSGVRPDGFNLPCQHSRLHYFKLIRAFGAPNGLARRSPSRNPLPLLKSHGDVRAITMPSARCF